MVLATHRFTYSLECVISLMILASEKDLVEKLSVDYIIDGFAGSSAPLQKLLLQNYAQK